MKKIASALFLLLAVSALAQEVKTTPQPKPTVRELTIENIFDPKQRVQFGGVAQSGFNWIDDKTFAWPRVDETGKVVEQAVLETETGNRRVLFNASKLEAAAKKIAGVSAEEAAGFTRQRGWNFSPNKHSVLLTIGNDVYMYAFDADSMTRLTSSPGEKQEVAWSPDGKFVSFVRDNNIYVVDVATQRERQLTTDGNENIQNGILDWVYQEEVYGRGNFRAYWWSPDSSRIAYLQLDERPVKRFAVVDHIPYQQNVEAELYPKAGAPNPLVKLFTVSVAGSEPREVSTESYSGGEFLIVLVSWSPDSSKVVYQVQNREQTWLDLDAAEPRGGMPKTLFRETTKAWVEPTGNPVWLKDGSFLWLSERTGFKHLYQYSADGKQIRQITNGPWEVRNLHGIDPANEWIYFSGTERSVLGSDLYRVRLDGTNLKRLTDAAGTHRINFNPSLTAYLDTYSNVTTPPSTSLYRNDGTRVRVIDANEAPLMGNLRLSTPEFLQIKTRDGFPMEAMIIRPPDFDPSKKYPVFEHTYSGPHAQQVVNAWMGPTYLFHQFLAQHGVIVFVCDNRSASGKGMESAWTSYKRVGEPELRDLEDAVRWLSAQPGVDASRVMLEGWSFGGFMTSFALTHSTLWSSGISGGTVTDWHDYDSIYTERVMLMPQNNPEGYQATAPRFAAKNLHGNILLLHGTIDDNVHLQNTIQFIYELEKANKPYQLQLYPKSRHGVTDPALNLHLRNTMWTFIQQNLGVK